MTTEETTQLLSILSSVFPTHPVTDDTVTAWVWALEDIPWESAKDAARRWIQGKSPFFPTPGQLRHLIATKHVGMELIPETAWIEVTDQAHRVGYGRRTVYHNGESRVLPGPSFSHPLIEQAVASVGWKNICQSDEQTIVRAQFVKTLTNLIDAEVARTQVSDLSLSAGEAIELGAPRMAELASKNGSAR